MTPPRLRAPGGGKAAIDQTDGAILDRYRFDLGAFGDYEKTRLPDEATAREWQRKHAGYVVRYGSQAVAILNGLVRSTL
ncbi:hypothetical protein GCM10027419_25890 [Pandoraea terrae]